MGNSFATRQMDGIILVDICEFDLVGMVSNLDLRK